MTGGDKKSQLKKMPLFSKEKRRGLTLSSGVFLCINIHGNAYYRRSRTQATAKKALTSPQSEGAKRRKKPDKTRKFPYFYAECPSRGKVMG